MRRGPGDKRTSAEWVWIVLFPLLLGLSLFAGYRIIQSGAGAILDATDGDVAQVVTNPRLPGYRAIVEPTAVSAALLVHSDELVGAAVVVPVANGVGGTWFVIPPDIFLDGQTLATTFESDGVPGATGALQLFTALRLEEVAVVDQQEWEKLFGSRPVTVQLADDLVQVDGTVQFASGELTIDAASIGEVLGWLNPGEVSANRLSRHNDVITSWLAAVSDPAVTLGDDVPLATSLNSMVQGVLNTATIPIVATNSLGFVPDIDLFQTMVHELAPFAPSEASVLRPQTLVLNGASSDPELTLKFVTQVAVAGAQVTALGNEDAFLRTESSLIVSSELWMEFGEEIADALGIGTVILDPEDNPAFDLVVHLGLDLVGP
jgi:hypothetical protein